MTEPAKICAACANNYFDPATPKYRRCRKGDATGDGSLCSVMRRGEACGPDAKLWEAIDGQA